MGNECGQLPRWEWSDNELDALIEVRSVRCVFGRGTPAEDSELLRAAFGQVFVSSAEIRALLRQFVSYLQSFFQTVFSDESAYLNGIYSRDPWAAYEFPAICFTGYAGTGKSAIRRAFFRLIGSPSTRDLVGHRGLPNVPAWPVSLRNGTSWGALLLPHLDAAESLDAAGTNRRDPPTRKLLEIARRQTWRDMTCFLWPDEFQQVSFSGEANAKATTILYGLLAIGPRLIFTANFSLVHALMKRKQQDIQRLITVPVIVEPLRQGSGDIPALLAAYKAVAPNALAFDIGAAESIIYECTYGIIRNIVNLIARAYRHAGECGRNAVNIEDLHTAYAAYDMRAQRDEVKKLFEQDLSGAASRADLWSPFPVPPRPASSVIDLSKARESFEAKVEAGLLLDTLLPKQAEAVRQLVPQFSAPPKTDGEVVRMRRTKATRQSLIDGIIAFNK